MRSLEALDITSRERRDVRGFFDYKKTKWLGQGDAPSNCFKGLTW